MLNISSSKSLRVAFPAGIYMYLENIKERTDMHMIKCNLPIPGEKIISVF